MADLSDDELRGIALVTGGAPFTPFATMRAAIAADRALNAPQAAPVAQAERAGWVLVPVEPTPEMVRALADNVSLMDFEQGSRVGYAAMLAVTPTPCDGTEAR